MWIYFYASFGPGHQSNDYGFKYFHDDYETEDIKEHLFSMLSDHYDIVLRFWKVKRPPAKLAEDTIVSVKAQIARAKEYLKILESISCFVPDEKEGEDVIIKRNLRQCYSDEDLLKRLHNAGFMYGADDLCNWRYGKKFPAEPNRSKILKIMRRAKKMGRK